MARTREQLEADRNSVLAALTDEWASTSEIAEALGRSASTVGTDCNWLKKHGKIKTRIGPSPKKLLFCVECKEVVTAANYADCRGKEQRPFFPKRREWRRAG